MVLSHRIRWQSKQRSQAKNKCFNGKGIFKRIELSLSNDKSTFTFPFTACFPNDKNKSHKTFINISFGEMQPNSDIPLEYMCERGFAIMSYHFKDVAADSDEFENGLLSHFKDQDIIAKRKLGKLSVWAYAVMRILDYALTLDEVDSDHVAIVGHSRLGSRKISRNTKVTKIISRLISIL